MILLLEPLIFILPSIEVYFILFIIGILPYFFWRWLYKKYIKDKQKQKVAIWVSTIIITPIIYIGLIYIYIIYITSEPSRDFDKTKWMADKQGRFKMGDHIVKSKILINKDTNEVKQMLGSPTIQDSLNLHWTYNMGVGGGGLGFLFHDLSIQFNNNKVTTVLHNRVDD